MKQKTQQNFSNISFTKRTLSVVAGIPKGKTLSYKQVASLAGSPRAYRAVGTIMANNYNMSIPCHRVICSNGSIGNYNRGIHEKREKLQQEGAL